MVIREVVESDFDQLLLLYTELHSNPMPKQNGRLNTLWSVILNDDGYHIVVAEENDQIVSSCTLVIVPNLTHQQRPYALVENVITAREHQGKGFASACLDYARGIAKRANCYKIMLLTGSKQESTHQFYRRAGYNSQDKTAFIQWLEP